MKNSSEIPMHTLKKGILVSVEGIDGSGKSTLTQKLFSLLQGEQLPVFLTREPGATQLGKELRTVVQEKKFPVCSKAEYLIFAADRAQHFDEIIIPYLHENKLILSDRMADSSLVYQGYGRGLNMGIIETVNRWVMHGIQPNITFYVRVTPKTALERITKRATARSAFEQETFEFFQQLVEGFDALFKNRQNCVILDGEQSQEKILNDAYNFIIQWIQKNNLLD